MASHHTNFRYTRKTIHTKKLITSSSHHTIHHSITYSRTPLPSELGARGVRLYVILCELYDGYTYAINFSITYSRTYLVLISQIDVHTTQSISQIDVHATESISQDSVHTTN